MITCQENISEEKKIWSTEGFFRKSTFCTLVDANPGFDGHWVMPEIFLLNGTFTMLEMTGIFVSFLAGLGQKSTVLCMLLSLNCPPTIQFKPVVQSRKKMLRAYCPNIYTLHTALQTTALHQTFFCINYIFQSTHVYYGTYDLIARL